MCIETALKALADGLPVLVADARDRENEVDVILSAERATEKWIAWTVRHTSGYLYAPMPAARADMLGLPLMVTKSQDPRQTAYAVSVDAAVGITTGISAADRTRTLRALASPHAVASDLIRPGNILPLRGCRRGARACRSHRSRC